MWITDVHNANNSGIIEITRYIIKITTNPINPLIINFFINVFLFLSVLLNKYNRNPIVINKMLIKRFINNRIVTVLPIKIFLLLSIEQPLKFWNLGTTTIKIIETTIEIMAIIEKIFCKSRKML